MVWLQLPSPLQESAVQPSPSSQLYVVPAQVPAAHVSLLVQAFPSLHPVPLGAGGFEQVPVDASHVPAT